MNDWIETPYHAYNKNTMIACIIGFCLYLFTPLIFIDLIVLSYFIIPLSGISILITWKEYTNKIKQEIYINFIIQTPKHYLTMMNDLKRGGVL